MISPVLQVSAIAGCFGAIFKEAVNSQRIRKRVEEIFGWCKSIGGMAPSRFVGRWKLKQQSEVTAAAYNLLRMARLAPSA